MTSTFTQPDFSAQNGAAYKGNIDGAADVLKRAGAAFAPHEQAAPDLTVRVDAGFIPAIDGIAAEIAAQSTAAVIAPATNPRNDIVYIDRSSGAAGVEAGVEAAAPADPALPAGKIALARIRLTVGMTEITNADLDDLRDGWQGLGTAAGQNMGALPAAVLADTVAISGTITPAQITVDQNDYNPPGLSSASVLRLNSNATRTLTGIAGGAAGRLLVLHNIGANDISLSDADAGSAAANRFALAENKTVTAGEAAVLQYDSTSSRWRMISLTAAAGGGVLAVNVYTAGTTWNRTAGAKRAWVRANGGGGGGGSAGGSAVNNAGAGGTTSLGALLTAGGGGAGASGPAGGAGGAGGTASGGDINIAGGAGAGKSGSTGGAGGTAPGIAGFGTPGIAGNPGTAAAGFGAGGGGANDVSAGGGGGGGAFVEEFVDVSGTASETVTIGAGGAGGTHPSVPANYGGNGAPGWMMIVEFG